jgi:hypothetical protein
MAARQACTRKETASFARNSMRSSVKHLKNCLKFYQRSDAAATNTTTAIGFYYKRVSAGETNTAWTSSSSLLTTAGNDQMYVIKVNAADLPLVSNVTYEYCYLNVAETTDDPALGGVIVMMADPRYDEATLDAVTA